jgi:hypothetical protein
MTFLIRTWRGEEGSAMVLAFVFLVVLTLIGVFSARTATIDIQIASNEIPYQQNFYIAEGGLHREAAEVGRGCYAISNAKEPCSLVVWNVGNSTAGLPPPVPHEINGRSYNFEVAYMGFFPPPAGYSILHFSRYDYDISTAQGGVTVRARYFKIGPKAE